MARRKKKVRQPGFWAMVGRGWRKFKAFLGSDLWYCPHGWGRFCPKCRRWTVRQIAKKAGLQEIVKTRKGKSVQPIFDGIYEEMAVEDLDVLNELDVLMVETEAEDVSLSREDTARSEPQPRPQTEEETETCPACESVKIAGGVCPMCGHVTGDEVPYDVPEAVEDPEDVE